MTDDPRDKQPKKHQSGAGSGNGRQRDSETNNHIGRMIRASYDEIAHEPVPEKFLDLLKQLEAQKSRKR